MEDKYSKILVGTSIPLMEVDDEMEADLNGELIDYAKKSADFLEIINRIGEEDFKEIYFNLKHNIISSSIEEQKNLCREILKKISEVYDYTPNEKLNFDNIIVIKEIYDFIEFLEFDYIDFMGLLFKSFDLQKLKKDHDTVVEDNSEKLMDKIDSILKITNYSLLINNFLRTNNRDNLISFIKEKLEKSKMMIILKIMEGEI